MCAAQVEDVRVKGRTQVRLPQCAAGKKAARYSPRSIEDERSNPSAVMAVERKPQVVTAPLNSPAVMEVSCKPAAKGTGVTCSLPQSHGLPPTPLNATH
ncbi:hypothetical protein SKAU_G00392570 [Synaphobranchus kaupii]|uniref:Uncharacterized protein n=1 Tax=Synaphobranchus kaupii TaxID=118154 RepID=A0A9Q1EBX3_SYNKA|nr:hypothetical protein SKAU_G00392570 [Synaphobranchus kaupii]